MGSWKWLIKLSLLCASVIAAWLLGTALRENDSDDAASATNVVTATIETCVDAE